MQDFRYTTAPIEPLVEGNNHRHVVYINEEAGYGLASIDEEHTHDVIFTPPTPGQQQPDGTISDSMPGSFQLGPADDGHLHDIISYPITKGKKEDEQDVISECYRLLASAIEIEYESNKLAQEADEFYEGEGQWDHSIKQYLKERDRVALTINKTERILDTLNGHIRESRGDIVYAPVEGGDTRAADLYNVVVKQILEQCYFAREESKTCEDLTIRGRGTLNLYVDFDENIEGDIKTERFPPDNVLYGPHEKEDLSDCEYIVKDKMYSIYTLKELWPEYEDRITEAFAYYLNPPVSEHHSYTTDQYAASTNLYPASVAGTEIVSIAKKEMRVVEVQRRVYKPVVVAAVPADNFYPVLFGWKAADRKKLSTIPGVIPIEKKQRQIRITKIVGNVLLSDENPANLPVHDFFVVPYYCKKRGGKFWGKVKSLMDPQRELNKRRSQAVDIGNKMCAYGWFTTPDTFPDEEEERKFKKNCNSPGFHSVVTDYSQIPRQVEGVKFPSELAQLMTMSDQEMESLGGVTAETAGANESGQAFMQRHNLKFISNKHIFDNIAFARKRVGRLLLALVQRYYTPERIYRIVSHQNAKEPVNVGGQPFESFSVEEIRQIVSNIDITKYDVVVTEGSNAPTARMATFYTLAEMTKAGQQIPPDVLLDLAPIPAQQKEKILQSMAQASAAQAEAEKQKQRSEMWKPLIADGVYPPELQQEIAQSRGQQGQPQPGQLPPGQQQPQPQLPPNLATDQRTLAQ